MNGSTSVKRGGAGRRRAVIYLRVSSKKQVEKDYDPEGLSLPSQRKMCQATADKLGADIIREYVEPGVSGGSVLKRKAFKKMLADAEELRDVDLVIFWKVSRWARDEIDQWTAFGLVRNLDIELASSCEPIDSSPTGMLVFGIMGSIAAHQRRELSIEVKRTMIQKVEVGGTPGRAPIGYVNKTVEIDGRPVRDVVLDPVRAPLIKEAFYLYGSGEFTLIELAALLEERGLRSRATRKAPEQAVGVNRLQQLLRNPYYIGDVRYSGKVYKGRHQPMIDQATFQDVQDQLDAKRKSGEKAWRHFHYLRGTVYCGECGGRLTYTRTKGNGGEYEYLLCTDRSCVQGYNRADAVEAAIESHWSIVQLADSYRIRVRAAVADRVGQIAKLAENKLDEARQDLSRLASEERKLLKAHYADQVSDDLFGEEQARIRRERADAEQTIATLDVEHQRVLEGLDAAIELLQDMQLAYLQAEPNERRLLNQAFFERIEVVDEKVVGFRFADPFGLLLGQPQEKEDGEDFFGRWSECWNLGHKETVSAGEPDNGATEAKTTDPVYGAGGYNVETLVRAEGLEPPRAEAHQDLNLARIPIPPRPRGALTGLTSGQLPRPPQIL
jgi:site-specific DNA recombinase